MNDCPSVELLDQMLSDQLEAARATVVERHVSGCTRCQEMLERMTDSFATLSPHLPRTSPEGFPSEVWERMAATPPPLKSRQDQDTAEYDCGYPLRFHIVGGGPARCPRL